MVDTIVESAALVATLGSFPDENANQVNTGSYYHAAKADSLA